jgi:hypothetical protein
VAYREYVKKDWCEDCKDVIMMLISTVKNGHMNIAWKDLFKEPLASGVEEFIKTKEKSTLGDYGVSMQDSLHNLLQPAYMDVETPQAKAMMAQLEKINLMNGWEPDSTQKYFIEHSRHDNYVPIQSVRAIIPWMREKGFTPSIVPGKTNLQTNTLVFKLDHSLSAIVWLIQTVAAIQFWPVLYYEGEQNRYYHDIVGDLNLMKVIKTLESWGVDLKKVVNDGGFARRKTNAFDLIPNINEILGKVDLTTNDLEEMCEDSGITQADLISAFLYLKAGIGAREHESGTTLEETVEAPLYLLRYYEQQLANWFLLAGYDVNYNLWGL